MQTPRCWLAAVLGSLIVIPCAAWAQQNDVLNLKRADPALTRFVQSVVEANPRVQAAQAALSASGAMRDAALRPLYNPELSLDAENAESDTRSLGLSQTFDWGGKRKARGAVAESDRLVVQAQYLALRWAITVELLEGLAQHQTGVERDTLAAARRDLMNDFAALAQRRFDAGDLNRVEFDLARLVSTDARIQKATAGAALAQARQAVRNLTPRGPTSQWPSLPNVMPTLPTSATSPQSLVLDLPEVLVVRRQLESADAMVELRRRERRPDPTVSLVGGEENGERLVGLTLSMPLFIRNSFNHEVSAAIAQRSQAQQLADDVMQRAHARLISATERYELSRGAWQDWQQTGQISLTRQTQQLQKLWEVGELSTTDYLVQIRQTLDVQESALDLREALWRALFEWLWASGQVDAWFGQGVKQ
ncbi:MAG: TolC family protein [Gammaproteobacteria bacterium]|nr:TolC family protein [Gammaproteobacteria bacterium]